MEQYLNNTVQFITIVIFMSGVVKLLIVNPLQTAITALKEAITKMDSLLTRLDYEQKCIDKRLVAVEESAKSAHKRLDGLEVH